MILCIAPLRPAGKELMMQATQRPLSDCYRIHIHKGTQFLEKNKKAKRGKEGNAAFVVR